MSKLWKKWLKITKKIVNFQVGLVLIISFLFFIVPASVIVNNLKIKKGKTSKRSYWIKKQSIKSNLVNASKQ